MPFLTKKTPIPSNGAAPALPKLLQMSRRTEDNRLQVLAVARSKLLLQLAQLRSDIDGGKYMAESREKIALIDHTNDAAQQRAAQCWEQLAELERKEPFLVQLLADNDRLTTETHGVIAREVEAAIKTAMIPHLERIIANVGALAPDFAALKHLAGKSAVLGQNSASYQHLLLDFTQWVRIASSSLKFISNAAQDAANTEAAVGRDADPPDLGPVREHHAR